MKKKAFVIAVILSLLLSGMLVAVGGEAREEVENEGEKVNENVSGESEPELTDLADTPWPMFSGGLKHTGRSPYDTSQGDGNLKWSFSTGDIVQSSPAIGSDGTIYVGSYDNKLYAINPDGSLKWDYSIGASVYSSPAIGSDGTIYVGENDPNLYAINPNGTEKWSFETGSSVLSSPAIGSDGTIYVGSFDDKLYAIKPDGTKKWTYNTGGIVRSSPAIGSEGTIYVGSCNNNLYALYPGNGTKKWSFSTGDNVHSSPAIGSDGTIYVGSNDNKLYAINPDGTKKWSFSTGNDVRPSPAIGSGGTIYVGSLDDKLYALHSEQTDGEAGTEKWSFETAFSVLSSPAIGSGGTIYVGSADNRLYAINPDGTKKWSISTGDEIHSSPVIGSNGTIYIGSLDNDLYAIGSPPSAPQNLQASKGDGQVQLTWNPPSDCGGLSITEYKIYRGMSSGTLSYHNSVDGNTTYYTDTGLTNGQTYYYKVSAVNSLGEGPSSTEENATPMPAPTTLSINIEGEGSTTPSEGNHTYEEGTEVTVEATPAEGWKFVEWTGDETGTAPTIDITIDENKSVTAVFEELEEYDLSINIEGEGSTTPSEGNHTYEEGTDVTVEATPAEGCKFVEWTGDETGTAPTIDITMDENKSVTAVFEELKPAFEITDFNVDPTEGYVPLEVDITAEIENIGGAEGTIKLKTDGVELGNWTLSPGDNRSVDETYTYDEEGSYHVELGNESIAVEVGEVVTYTLEVNIEGEGTVDVQPDREEYEDGTEVKLTADPAEGWGFEEWVGDYEGSEKQTTITMDENKSITARFEELESAFEITDFNVDPTEGDPPLEVTITAEIENVGDTEGTITLETDDQELYRWTLAPGDNASIDETYTYEEEGLYYVDLGNESISVQVGEVVTHTLEVNTDGQGTVDVEPDREEYEDGTEVTLTADPAEGWEFIEWTGDSEGAEEEITITMDDDCTITAHFEEVEMWVEIVSPGEDEILNKSEVEVEWESRDADHHEVRLNDGGWIDVGDETTYGFEALVDGTHTFDLRAAGMGVFVYDSINFTVDTTPPDLEIIEPAYGEFLDRSDISVEWECEDTVSGIDYLGIRVDEGNDGNWTEWRALQDTSYRLENLIDGEYRVEVGAVDKARHSAKESVEFIVDTTPPDIHFVSPKEGKVFEDDSVTVEWDVRSDTSRVDHYQVRIDDGDWNQIGEFEEYDFTDLSDGKHTVEVRAVDNAGNVGSETTEFEISTEDTSYMQVSESCLLPLLLAIIIAVLVVAGLYSWKKSEDEKEPSGMRVAPPTKRKVLTKRETPSRDIDRAKTDISQTEDETEITGQSEWMEDKSEAEEGSEDKEVFEEPSELEGSEETLEGSIEEEMDIDKLRVVEGFQKIKGIGSGIAHSLYEEGFHSKEELKEAEIEDIRSIEGIGHTQAELIHDSIQEDEERIQKTPTITEEDFKSHELGPMVKGREMKEEVEDKDTAPQVEDTDMKTQKIDSEVFKDETGGSEKIPKEEAIEELTQLRSVGSDKAEKLYDNGIRSLGDLGNISEKDLREIKGIGPALSERILDSLEDIDEESRKE